MIDKGNPFPFSDTSQSREGVFLVGEFYQGGFRVLESNQESYKTYEAAADEARRLARVNNDREYGVIQLHTRFKVEQVVAEEKISDADWKTKFRTTPGPTTRTPNERDVEQILSGLTKR